MIRAEEFGFKVGNDALSNAKALQLAISCGGDISVTIPGVYDVSEQLVIGSNTSSGNVNLICCDINLMKE